MRVVHIEPEPLHVLHHADAAPGGGTRTRALPLLRARVDGLPPQLDALLVTSDLQGRARLAAAGGAMHLLGEVPRRPAAGGTCWSAAGRAKLVACAGFCRVKRWLDAQVS